MFDRWTIFAELRRLSAERGQDMVEYALLVALLALFCVAAITLGGQGISAVFIAIWNTFVGAA